MGENIRPQTDRPMSRGQYEALQREAEKHAARDSAVVIIPVPNGFAQEEALIQLNQLLISLLTHGMPEREIAKRLMRYHPAQEEV